MYEFRQSFHLFVLDGAFKAPKKSTKSFSKYAESDRTRLKSLQKQVISHLQLIADTMNKKVLQSEDFWILKETINTKKQLRAMVHFKKLKELSKHIQTLASSQAYTLLVDTVKDLKELPEKICLCKSVIQFLVKLTTSFVEALMFMKEHLKNTCSSLIQCMSKNHYMAYCVTNYSVCSVFFARFHEIQFQCTEVLKCLNLLYELISGESLGIAIRDIPRKLAQKKVEECLDALFETSLQEIEEVDEGEEIQEDQKNEDMIVQTKLFEKPKKSKKRSASDNNEVENWLKETAKEMDDAPSNSFFSEIAKEDLEAKKKKRKKKKAPAEGFVVKTKANLIEKKKFQEEKKKEEEKKKKSNKVSSASKQDFLKMLLNK